MQRIRLFDTTLRDGELSPHFRPAADERLEIALTLDAAGIDVIELAYADDGDARLAESKDIAMRLEKAVPCILSPLNEEGLARARAFIDGIGRARLHLYLDARRIRALESDPGLEKEIFAEMGALIGEARRHVDELEFSPQDATRTGQATLVKVVAAGIGAGADIISISDTTGTAMPQEVEGIFAALRKSIAGLDSAVLALHAHNHQGRATQNSLAAIRAGALQIEGTVGGVGPAGGNTDLVSVLRTARQDEGLSDRVAHVDFDKLEGLHAQPLFRRSG